MECSVEGCTRKRKYVKTGWCQTHYHRYWRTGSLEIVAKPLRTNLTYYGAHGRVKAAFGSATKHKCVECGGDADEWAYDGTDSTELTGRVFNGKYPVTYSVWPEFYMPLCSACHRARDARLRSDRRTHCRNGHEMSPENTYERPSRRGTRECKACKEANYRKRRAKLKED